MEITAVEVMIVNRVREVRSIPPSPFSIGAGVKERETRGPRQARAFSREELWGVIKHF